MKIKKLSLKNIRSYKEHEIAFPEGSILLSGDIGSGKTTILLAIEFALFGLQPGQRGSSLLANGEDYGEISLDFEIDNQDITIKRNLKRSSKSVTQDYATLIINKQEHDLSLTELKTRVLEMLSYPEEFLKKTNLLYRYTLYSPQEEMKQIILENPDDRLNVLRHIFGIDKYKRINENTILVATKMREEAKILQAEVKDIDSFRIKKKESEDHLNFLDKEIEEKSRTLSGKVSFRKALEDETIALSLKIEEKKKFEKEIEKANILLKSKSQNVSEIEKEISDINKKISETPQRFMQEEFEKLIADIEKNKGDIESLNKNIAEFIGRLSSLNQKKEDFAKRKRMIFDIKVCPTCLQDVPERHKHNILNETESQISSVEKESKILILEIEKIKDSLSLLKDGSAVLEQKKSQLFMLKMKTEEIDRSKIKMNDLAKLKDSLKKDFEFLEEHINLLKKSVLEFSRFDSQYKIKESELKEAFNDEKQWEIKIAELKKEKELLEKTLVSIEKEIISKSEKHQKAKSISEVEDWLSNDFTNLINYTERNILLKLREEFSKLFNKWFSMLTTDSFYVQLDENFTPIIMQGDYDLDYSFLSGGERTAVALAYRLALNQLINSMFSKLKTRDIIILDEPTDGFSEQQLDKVRDILQELNVKQLILVSHEQKIESFVDNIIRLKKENGYTVQET